MDDKELEAHEDVLGFYNVPDIGAETVVSAIKDVFLKLLLSLVNCRGQCHDEASDMMGHKTDVAKRIRDLQPKAYPTHCHGHSLSLSVKDTTKNCKLLSDTMDTAKEIVFLIKVFTKTRKSPGGNKRKPRWPGIWSQGHTWPLAH